MPSSFSALDTGFPNLNKYGNNTEAKLKAIESYLVQLLEHLRYTLNNLGAENFNEASLRQITDPLRVNVQGIYADEWKSGTSYYASDVVKISTADTVEYYKALADHTSSAANKPPSASWEKVSAPNVQSMLDIGLSGITLSYDNDRVGSGDHNASYIKLTKDGTEIAGGKVFIKDLDASTIKTGTLDASKINLLESFSVKSVAPDTTVVNCGAVGGSVTEISGSYQGSMLIQSPQVGNKMTSITVQNNVCGLNAISDADNILDLAQISLYSSPPQELQIYVSEQNSQTHTTEELTVEITKGGIYIRKLANGVSKYYNLLDLLDRI